MPTVPDQVLFHRGATRIHLKLSGTDRRYWLKVNDGVPTPITRQELGDLLYDWFYFLKAQGVEIAPFDPSKGQR